MSEQKIGTGLTEDMNTCESCKHWDDEGHQNRYLNTRECTKVTMLYDSIEYNKSTDKYQLKERKKDCKAFVQDASDYSATLYTMPDFGCVMWETKP